MPNVPNPQSEFLREPNLLIPGKKPVGSVKIQSGYSVRWCLFPEDPVSIPGGKDLLKVTSSDSGMNASVNSGNLFHTGNKAITPSGATQDKQYSSNNEKVSGEDFSVMIHLLAAADSTTYCIGLGGTTKLAVSTRLNAGPWGIYTTTTSQQAAGTTTLTDGDEYVLIIRRGITGEYLDCIANGVIDSNVALLNFTVGGTTTTINSYQPNGNLGGDQPYFSVTFFDQALTDEEAADLTRDPYQFLIPA